MKFMPANDAFDDWAPTYEAEAAAMIESRGYSYEELGATVARELDPAPGACVLEVGTGPGNLGRCVRAAAPSLRLRGLDVSPAMARQAARSGAYADAVVGSATRLPYEGGAFDGAFSAFVWHSVLRPRRALGELRRVLRPGGRAVLVDLFPVGRGALGAALHGLATSLRREHGAPAWYRPLPDFLAEADRAGFDVSSVRRLGEPRPYTHYLITLGRRPR